MQPYFLKLKTNLELGESLEGSISTKHNAIRTYVKNNNPSVKDSKLIGSLQRRTRIHPGPNGKIDIDILVIMGEFHAWVQQGGISPTQALDSLHETVEDSDRYNGKDPTQDAPAICLTYEDDIEVELVPAYVDHIGHDASGNYLGPKGRGYWVPKNGKWEIADYDHEAEYISKMNELSDYHLIPMIKILKAIKRKYFPLLESFPLEILASRVVPVIVATKKASNNAIYYHDLLQEFFEQASPSLAAPLKIPDSKAASIVLTQNDKLALETVFAQIADHIRQTNQETSQEKKIARWRALIGIIFPQQYKTYENKIH